MGVYSRFCKDFPKRVLEQLIQQKARHDWNEREVTNLLMAANGFLLTFEKLRHTSGTLEPDKFKDRPEYHLVKFLQQPLKNLSDSNTENNLSNEIHFKYAIVKDYNEDITKITDARTFFEWNPRHKDRLKNEDLTTSSEKFLDILFLMRNALAHCNIYFDASQNNQIEMIWFASQKINKETHKRTLKFMAFTPFKLYLFLKFVLEKFSNESQLFMQLVDSDFSENRDVA